MATMGFCEKGDNLLLQTVSLCTGSNEAWKIIQDHSRENILRGQR